MRLTTTVLSKGKDTIPEGEKSAEIRDAIVDNINHYRLLEKLQFSCNYKKMQIVQRQNAVITQENIANYAVELSSMFKLR